MDYWILNQWPKKDDKGFGTKKERKKESIEHAMIIELNRNKSIM